MVLALAILLSAGPPFGSSAAAQPRGWASHTRRARQVEALRAEAPAERVAAARALRAARPTPALLRALREALETTNDPIAIGEIAATLAWHDDRGATPTLVATFRSAPPQSAPGLARALGTLGTPAGLRALVEGLDVPETADAARAGLLRAGAVALPWLRRALREGPTLGAIEVAGHLGDSSVVPALVAIVHSEAAPLRVAAIQALAMIGDERAASAVRARLGDLEPTVVEAAIRALGTLGSRADAEPLLELLTESEATRERAILEALLRIAPMRGRDAIVARITSDDPSAVRRATETVLAHPQPELAAVFHGLFQHGVRRAQAASALAELEDGAGLPALLAEIDRLGELSPEAREDVTRALAVALRRWSLSEDARDRALGQLLRALGDGRDTPRGLVLRALAGEPTVVAPLGRALQSDDVATRAWAAQGLGLLQEPADGAERLLARLAVEGEADVLRALLRAISALGLRVPDPRITALSARPELGAAPLLVLRGPQPEARRQALRRALRQSDRATRVGAALALAATGDRAAWRALMERVDQDDDPAVRRASADALAALAVPAARRPLGRRARIESDGRVRQALRAAAAGRRRPIPRGRGVLRFAVRAAGAPGGVPVQITLPGGAIWQIRTLPTGEVIVPGQPSGAADVRVLLDEAGL